MADRYLKIISFFAFSFFTISGGVSCNAQAAGVTNADKPIRVSPDGRYLMQPNGEPFFFLSENVEYHAWLMTREDFELYLKDRASKGINVILFQVVPKWNVDEPNVYGDRAFINSDPLRPNPRYFAHIDWMIERARVHGMRVALTPLLGITHLAGFPKRQKIFTDANIEQYGHWLGARYRNKGIIWVIGWDSTPIWPDDLIASDKMMIDFRPKFDLMAKGLTEGQGEDPLILYHITGLSFPGTSPPRTSLYLSNRAWLDVNTLQSSHFLDQSAHMEKLGADFGWNSTYNYEPVSAEYSSLPVRPIIDLEPQYENIPRDLVNDISKGRWDANDIRNSAYHAVFAGAAGHAYNHHSVVYLYDPTDKESRYDDYVPNVPWKEALNAPGARQIGFIKKLMLSRPYFSRIPDQSIIIGETGEGRAHIGATRDRDGSYAMLYLPLGQSVTVDTTKISGAALRGWWFDPRTGAAKPVDHPIRANAKQMFAPPSNGWGNDWILVIDDSSKEYGTPGG